MNSSVCHSEVVISTVNWCLVLIIEGLRQREAYVPISVRFFKLLGIH